jgi:hypothetical protein
MGKIVAILGGLAEGLVLPTMEFLFAVFIGVVLVTLTINQGHLAPNPPRTQSIDVLFVLVVFAAMNLLETFFTGLIGDFTYALSYSVASIAGVVFFSPVVVSIFPDASLAIMGEFLIVAACIVLKIAIIALSGGGVKDKINMNPVALHPPKPPTGTYPEEQF